MSTFTRVEIEMTPDGETDVYVNGILRGQCPYGMDALSPHSWGVPNNGGPLLSEDDRNRLVKLYSEAKLFL